MTDLGFHEKLLDGAEVEWKPLGAVAEIKRGNSITKKNIKPGDIPVIAGGRSPAYYHNESNRTDQTIVVAGSGAYAGFVSWWEEPIFVSDAFSVKALAGLEPRYCFHWLTSLQERIHDLKSGGGVPHVYPRDVAPLEIPIPCPEQPEKSLAIQGEIVRILDSFTELTAELTAELELRKKQYNHYRDELLAFEDLEVEWKALGELVNTITAPTKLNRSAYREKGTLPIVDQGASYLAGFTDEDVTPVSADEYVIFGDHSEHIKYVDFAFVQGADGLKILRPKNAIAKFIFYAFRSHYRKEGKYKRHWSKAKETLIPVPFTDDPEKSLAEQARIVAILDKFDTLTTSLSEGLPGEIELRQKQYEYYRDLLLSFPKPAENTKTAA